LLAGGEDWHGVKVASRAKQGTIFHFRDGVETMLHEGSGDTVSRAA
jgi:probable phosphoglycerate mutase